MNWKLSGKEKEESKLYIITYIYIYVCINISNLFSIQLLSRTFRKGLMAVIWKNVARILVNRGQAVPLEELAPCSDLLKTPFSEIERIIHQNYYYIGCMILFNWLNSCCDAYQFCNINLKSAEKSIVITFCFLLISTINYHRLYYYYFLCLKLSMVLKSDDYRLCFYLGKKVERIRIIKNSIQEIKTFIQMFVMCV